MTISANEDEDPARIRDIRSTLLLYQSPFNWDMPATVMSIEIYIKNQSEKCEVIEEEHQFQWTRFFPHLILSYEYCERKKDYIRALEHIRWCQDHWNELHISNCQEPLFLGLREVIAHVILATKANILLAAGKVDLARKELNMLSNYPYGDVTLLSSTKNKAGLLGLKAAVYMQYRVQACNRAVEAAREAIQLDPDQAEWWFILGNALGRIRRNGNNEEIVSDEEIEAIEKAFSLQKDASYTVHLAQVYAEYSTFLFFNWKYEKARTYAIRAATRFREALVLRPNCANLKARVAHGMIRIRCKEAMDIPFAKNLLDEVVKASPNRAMAYADLGLYYSLIEKDNEKAIYNYQKAFETGSIKAIRFLVSVKWKNGLEDQIVADVEEGLKRYLGPENQAMLYSYLGVCHALINDEWKEAILCFQKSLDFDPSAQYMERFRGFNGKYVNLLELITNHLHFKAADENQNTIQSFLAYVAQIKPQNIQFGSKNKFLYWKKELEEQKEHQTSMSRARIELTNVKQNVTTEQDVCIDKNQGSQKEHQTSMSRARIELTNVKQNVTTEQDVRIDKNQGSQNEHQTSMSRARIELTNVKQNVMTEQDVRIDKNQGSLERMSTQMAELIKSVNSLTSILATKEEIESIVTDVKVMKEEVDSVNEKVQAIEPRVIDAESRVEQLEAKVEALERVVMDGLSPEDLIGEINDRARRASNIILHNLPENVDEPIEMRIVNDKGLVLKVSEAMNYVLDSTKIHVHRIGKPVRGKCRPLIVTFETANEAKLFLEMRSVDSVKASDSDLANIGVTRDRTDRERRHHSSLREELESRASRGERNLVIKYKNGVPKILSRF